MALKWVTIMKKNKIKKNENENQILKNSL